MPETATSHIFQIGPGYRIEVEKARRSHLHTSLEAAGATAWLWCLDCERAFQLGEARRTERGIACAYANCKGESLDFWSWNAYRAFVGAAPEAPEAARRYPLAA